jgi:hypothetical protein
MEPQKSAESLSSSDENIISLPSRDIIDEKISSEVIPYDYMSAFSHHPSLKNQKGEPIKPLTKIQELKLIQKLLKNVKYVLTFEESILLEQKVYWLHLSGISGATTETQRSAIKIAIESHCLTPVCWLNDIEIAITVDPIKKMVKKKV